MTLGMIAAVAHLDGQLDRAAARGPQLKDWLIADWWAGVGLDYTRNVTEEATGSKPVSGIPPQCLLQLWPPSSCFERPLTMGCKV